MEGEKKFATAQEEIEYWKQLAEEYKKRHQDSREELEEYELSSRELEAELEAQLEQQEGKVRDLVAANERLQMEVELLREKVEEQTTVGHKQQTELMDELAQVKAFKDELQKYIRELEQSNDDLERAKRATVVSLEDFEARLNQAIERNAFLENELEERETLAITVQRLKDEARDLRNELAVTKKSDSDTDEPDNSSTALSSGVVLPSKLPDNEVKGSQVHTEDSNKLVEELGTPNTTPAKVLSHTGGTPLTPSARISALNIVGDLLRKVGTLENKLASCRNYVSNQPRTTKAGSSTSLSPSPSPRSSLQSPTSPVAGSSRFQLQQQPPSVQPALSPTSRLCQHQVKRRRDYIAVPPAQHPPSHLVIHPANQPESQFQCSPLSPHRH